MSIWGQCVHLSGMLVKIYLNHFSCGQEDCLCFKMPLFVVRDFALFGCVQHQWTGAVCHYLPAMCVCFRQGAVNLSYFTTAIESCPTDVPPIP